MQNFSQKPLLPLIIIFLAFLIRILALGNMSLLAEEAYYWNYANHLDFSYFDHPPMVAYLIKISTVIFGTNEFGVRLPAIICWSIAGIYSYKLSNLITNNTGIYALFLLSILPFFFIQSVIITPDLPLIAAWSASLYYLYQALIHNKNDAWLKLGLSFGLGMISKYTIVLLIPATFIYMGFNRQYLKKLQTPYPYIASLIALIIFSPVIYWNYKHAWASFAFQSKERFTSGYDFSLHEILGLLILFLTPIGIIGLWRICKNNNDTSIKSEARSFIRVYTLFPLIFFMLFSIFHTTKFNWIGPGLLAIIPWLANEALNVSQKISQMWNKIAIFLMILYTFIFVCIACGKPIVVYNAIFSKFINWDNFYFQIQKIAKSATQKNNLETVIVPLDKYNIASEISFYQAKHPKGAMRIYGRNVFGQDALMYNYWYNGENLANKNILIIHPDRYMFDADFIRNTTNAITKVKTIWPLSHGGGTKKNRFYYQIVTMRDNH